MWYWRILCFFCSLENSAGHPLPLSHNRLTTALHIDNSSTAFNYVNYLLLVHVHVLTKFNTVLQVISIIEGCHLGNWTYHIVAWLLMISFIYIINMSLCNAKSPQTPGSAAWHRYIPLRSSRPWYLSNTSRLVPRFPCSCRSHLMQYRDLLNSQPNWTGPLTVTLLLVVSDSISVFNFHKILTSTMVLC